MYPVYIRKHLVKIGYFMFKNTQFSFIYLYRVIDSFAVCMNNVFNIVMCKTISCDKNETAFFS